jgi:hypothetical protein
MACWMYRNACMQQLRGFPLLIHNLARAHENSTDSDKFTNRVWLH